MKNITEFQNQILKCQKIKDSFIETIDCDSTLAEHITKSHEFVNQRKLKTKNLHNIHNSIINGDFDFRLNAITVAVTKSYAALVNGNHRLKILGGYDKYPAISGNYPVRFNFIYCKDNNEVSEIYSKFDTGSSRTTQDQTKALGLANLLGVDEKVASKAVQVIKRLKSGRIVSSGSSRNNFPSTQYKNIVLKNIMIIQGYDNICKIGTNDKKIVNLMKRADFQSFCFVILKEEYKLATKFLMDLFDENTINKRKDNPITKLHKELYDYATRGYQGLDNKLIIWNKLCLAWERYMAKKPLKNWYHCQEKDNKGRIITNGIPYTRFNDENTFSKSADLIFG